MKNWQSKSLVGNKLNMGKYVVLNYCQRVYKMYLHILMLTEMSKMNIDI